MVFSSITFLFGFLPLVLVAHFLIPTTKLRNWFLLLASLIFYAWGEGSFTVVMVISVTLNYIFGILIDRYKETYLTQAVLIFSVVANLGFLIGLKYSNFLIENLNPLLSSAGISPIHLDKVHLPAGISFFTFHAISYTLDIYRGICNPQKNPGKLALYFDFFPQLIAGPIIRYHDVEAQLDRRTITITDFSMGVQRFIIGLSKKMLLANTLAAPVDQIFAIPNQQLTPGLAWFGIMGYTLQIYFDFSGYSDMAIGLGRMFGFRFLENFNYPYVSRSIREFWQRWHISLSSWFRDYLYIPLGGNRKGVRREHFNLLLVFLLCGFWHGANWNFVIWGLFHGIFLILERQLWMTWLTRFPSLLRHTYTLLVVLVGWVFFRAETLQQALTWLQSMLGHAPGDGIIYHVSLYWNWKIFWAILFGIIASTPILPWFQEKCRHHMVRLSDLQLTSQLLWLEAMFYSGGTISLLGLFLASILTMASGTYNPFIYFRF